MHVLLPILIRKVRNNDRKPAVTGRRETGTGLYFLVEDRSRMLMGLLPACMGTSFELRGSFSVRGRADSAWDASLSQDRMSSPPKGGKSKEKPDKENKEKPPPQQQQSSQPLADGDGRPGPSTSDPPPKSKSGGKKEHREESSGTTASSTSTPVAHNNNNQSNQKDGNKEKSCCFCWCCCCSCSCLSVHNQLKEKSNKMHQISTSGDNYFNGNDTDPPPTLEEIRSWGESFDRLMRCAAGRRVFREFLRCEYSEENILFWLACEDLKREKNPEVVEEKARSIYEDYVSILSPKEVSLDSKVREIVNKNMVAPTTTTFDEAQLQIYTLMHRDSYPRFVLSTLYRRMAQLSPPTPPTRKTSISVG
ncbi:regulator of G-protein signaling 20 [Nephila pilipes]|uniref:Regulator of G-protein signaling 20 n=1 Tax=Nephila pilipes TaxID=299642 RepID=A0A8X6JGR8_NEPPI|nr:regulator of G-protein signaling 20 [Nephila pilipes]